MTAVVSSTDAIVEKVLADSTSVVVAGRRRATSSRRALVAPVDGRPWTEVAIGGRQDAHDAAEAAARALPDWSATPAVERAAALRAVADELDAASATDGWPTLVTRETGKRLAEARAELGLSAVYFRVMADLLDEQQERVLRAVPGAVHHVEPRPLGVAAVLTPWNFPVSIPARKIAPALAAGCPVLFKPSEVAPLSSMVLAALLDRHVPAGTVNTVLGEPADVVDPWLAHPDVQVVSFTGSTWVGRLVAAAAAPRFLRTVLELGGCAPFIVLPDADVEHAVQTLLVAKYRNNGQSCIAANQVFVAREVAETFVDAFVAATERLVVGDPLDAATDVGPLAPAGDPARLAALVDDAVAAGARVAGTRASAPENGHWFAPTVVVDVPASAAASRDEVFGPLAAVSTYDDLDEAVAQHRATGYGLAGYVCGTDVEAARDVSRRLRAGIVGINTGTPNYPGAPFGGLGLSGTGYEGGPQGLEAFQAWRTTAVVGAAVS
ncbi:succinate-semialdehyde dehydrogenase/glutarate-semialdehyde dehydrogenase [Pseudonocardia hierapolitana]|uniref:Succinate-semialdehyde dehydrogenase/glutarate-semialdehyde dehydrogenase n=1 Tax=Pseudonocardia hierapolitana TaxID=1128676 RepID=A0A561SK20_9PSEU|nr:aldehyde dehydrogenase family protein [Pseudonocardia hierapolitana]TWF75199.1 succinate-semialdehyde dehydrogenase/glutarate-semialdehyde dehydrogenase [Pseudonocardia hierapolitana]